MPENRTDLPLHDHGGDFPSLLRFLPEPADADKVAAVFSCLGDGTRLRILFLLCHCEECVTDIAAAIRMSPPAVSHHLRVLKGAGLIASRRDGKETLYTLADTEEAALVHEMIDRVFCIKCPRKKD